MQKVTQRIVFIADWQDEKNNQTVYTTEQESVQMRFIIKPFFMD
jgi:hypothetical protein